MRERSTKLDALAALADVLVDYTWLDVFSSLGFGRLGPTLRLLWRQHRRIERYYYPRVVCMILNAAVSSTLARIERARYGRAVEGVELAPPVFVLGHWRSGTSFLHQLSASAVGNGSAVRLAESVPEHFSSHLPDR
ncbi:MAG: sulfotransferase [bacterium]|nr:sulfotransferase [bacterium]